MNIIKIGGAVLKDIKGFQQLVELIDNYSKRPLIVVISAFSSATKELRKSALLAEQGKFKQASVIINRIINEHKQFASELIKQDTVFESLAFLFDNSKERLYEIMKGLSITRELTPRTLDIVMSYGEFFALHTVFHFLQEKKFDVKCIDATNLIVSDDRFGAAKPLIPETTKQVKEKILPFSKGQKIILTQGFVAKNKSGEITTMGIESSNLTAVLLAEILNIQKITLLTDVAGIMTADPKYIKGYLPVPKLSYQQAYDYAWNGLKLIHPEMLNHATAKKIKLIYKSAFNPDGSQTEISDIKITNQLPVVTFFENVRFSEYYYSNHLPDYTLERNLIEKISQHSEILSQSYFTNGINVIYKENNDLDEELKKIYQKINITKCSYLIISLKDMHKFISLIQKSLDFANNDIISYAYSNSDFRLLIKNSNIKEIANKIHKKIIKLLE